MTFLRHAPRHVHQSMTDMVRGQLGILGWRGPEVPFGADPVTIIDTRPFIGGKLAEAIGSSGTTVAISLGTEPAPHSEELGGPLTSQDYPFFIDVFSDTEAVCTALSTDVKDILLARLPGTSRFLTLVDQTTGLPVPDWRLELEDVERVTPEHDFPLHWSAVHVTAVAYFPEKVY